MQEQRERARADAPAKRAVVALARTARRRDANFSATKGWRRRRTIVAILTATNAASDVRQRGEEAQILLDRTSFYAEKGGQIGDRGTIRGR